MMNREEAKKLLPAIQAFADGKEMVRQKDDGYAAIVLGNNINFNIPGKYFVKPEPLVIYARVHDDGSIGEILGKDNLVHRNGGWETRKFIEVTE